MNRGVAIARWLHAANRRLRGVATKVAVQLSQYTNRAAYESSGKLIAFQSIKAMAADTGLTGRTVQKNIRKMQAVGLVASEPNRGGRHRSNHYTLTLPADDAAETLSRRTPFSDQETLSREARNPVPLGPKPCPAGQTNYNNDTRTSATTAKTEPGGPRQRAVALGPPPETETGKGLGNGVAGLPDKPLGPLDVEQLQRLVGPDQFGSWLAGLTFVELADGVLTLAAPSRFVASQIVVRFERPLLESAPGQPTRLDVRVVP